MTTSAAPGWPDGNRIAILFSVNLEAWSDNKGPSYFPRTTPVKPGTVDLGAVQWGEYGGREGIWRLIRLFDRYDRKASMFCSGHAAELYPSAIEAITASGHSVEAHGWVQDQMMFDLTPDEQRTEIRRTLDLLEKTSGRRPEGWLTPAYGGNEATYDILADEGVLWHTDGLDYSLPSRQKTATSSIIQLPWSDFVDNRVLHASPRDYYDVYVDAFDYLYAQEPGGLLHLAMHTHHGARLHIAAQVDKLLRYFAQFTDVWFPTHSEVARWFDAQGVESVPYAYRFFPS